MLKPLILIVEGIAIGVLGTLLIQTVLSPSEVPVAVEDGVCEVPSHTPQEIDYKAGCSFEAPNGFNKMVEDAGTEFDINPRAIALTVWKESGCNANAFGSSGELGLMQVNPSVWGATLRAKGFEDLTDARTNVRAGAWVLAHIKARGYTDKGIIRRYNGSGPRARRYASAQESTYRKMWGAELEI